MRQVTVRLWVSLLRSNVILLQSSVYYYTCTHTVYFIWLLINTQRIIVETSRPMHFSVQSLCMFSSSKIFSCFRITQPYIISIMYEDVLCLWYISIFHMHVLRLKLLIFNYRSSVTWHKYWPWLQHMCRWRPTTLGISRHIENDNRRSVSLRFSVVETITLTRRSN